MKSIIEQTRELPPGVIGNVLTFIPRNDTAQLLMNANNNDELTLTYLRKYKVFEGDEIFRTQKNYKEELYSKLAPSKTGSNLYGDEDSQMKIYRSKISVGEKLKMKFGSRVVRMLTYEEEEDGFIAFE